MGLRGPAPKPSAIKKISGTYRSDRAATNEARPLKGNRSPAAPKWLPDDAKLIWKEHARKLWELNLLTDIDLDAYASYCETMALYRTAVELTRQPGGAVRMNTHGNLQATPWIAIRNICIDQLKRLWSEFGMTPSARSRINLPAQEETKDPFEQFLASETVAKREPPAEKPLRKTG